jgi:hypothetical protein
MPAASANAQLALASTGVSGSVTDTSCLNTIASLSPRTALTFWLSGYTPDPASPLYPNSSRKALFSFDTSRKAQNSSKRFTGEYSAPGNPDAQYWYMDSTSSAAELATFSFAREIDPSTGLAFNQDTFQIVNPGSDGSWGTDDDLSNFWPGTRKEYSSSSNK